MTTVWRPSAPDSIDADLAALWREASQDGPVSRALMSNLVVVSPTRTFAGIEEVARRHPARTILLSYTAGAHETAGPEGVRVGLLTVGEGAGRYGLEMIAVHTTCADASIPSIVQALTIGSVPTTVWWDADLSEPAPPEAVTSLGRQLVYDSAQWKDVKSGVAAAAAVLDRQQPPDIVDLNWRRTAPLRDAIVHALRAEGAGAALTSARVSHSRNDAAAACLVAGWLSSRAGVRVEAEHGTAALIDVDLAGRGWTISASMREHQIEVRSARPAFTTTVPAETEAGAIAAELLNLSADVGLRDALRALNGRL
ncbi:MAG TPA: glucose-6-phosphate dehydrogenase assembly protein OpcA [Vicinamibacterales bacterium]|jgi:glucose-6-phosphate dehydrogenase assembly protein OpcA|nr:glucose-6-phosphate dehydrogenase assembly protein OpcA [Vicinamibacterales bacterium]